MPDFAPLSTALNRLWLPRPALTACVRGILARDTRGLALTDAQRFNHFPATPLCSISWWFEGESQLLPPYAPAQADTPRQPLPARVLLAGPFTHPLCSWNPGPVHGMMLLLLPDALHHLTGVAAADWVNRFSPLPGVLPPDWVAMADSVATAPDDETRVALIQDFLAPRWQAQRPTRSHGAERYLDWAQALALRAATSAPGRSLRQVERRIKQWAGLPMRELRGIGRAEQAFFHTLATQQAGLPPDWAAVALDSGYADQSHLCRETRRVTGFAPQVLYQHIAQDEAFWSYRLWQ
ncbi:MAG: AraC family transcriptional regulator [Burkholderiales bacterium PBB5]|nr:MAG: AraC family transcriptional regulator [Burkholderiales bacterium PBB5]